MIPAAFKYIRPSSLDEAVQALADGGEDAKVIAGGQSLLPLLRLRLAYPDLLVDLGHVDGLRGVRDEGDTLWIGALTTHAEVVRDPVIREHCGLLAEATVGVAAIARRSNGHVAEARIGLTNMGPVPVRARAAEEAAAGAEADRSALRAAAAHADEDTQPPADLHGAPDYRRHLARVLTARALAVAAGA